MHGLHFRQGDMNHCAATVHYAICIFRPQTLTIFCLSTHLLQHNINIKMRLETVYICFHAASKWIIWSKSDHFRVVFDKLIPTTITLCIYLNNNNDDDNNINNNNTLPSYRTAFVKSRECQLLANLGTEIWFK